MNRLLLLAIIFFISNKFSIAQTNIDSVVEIRVVDTIQISQDTIDVNKSNEINNVNQLATISGNIIDAKDKVC